MCQLWHNLSLYRPSPRKDIYPLVRSNIWPLRANYQEAVRQRQRDDVAGSLPAQLCYPRLPALPFDPRGQEMSHRAFLVDRSYKLTAKHGQGPWCRPAQYVDRRQHKKFERHHGRYGISWQSEHELSSARREYGRPPGTYRDARKMKFRAQVAKHLLDEIVLPHRYAAGKNQNVRFQPAFNIFSECDF